MSTTFSGGLSARVFPAAIAVSLVGFGLYFDHAASAGGAPQQRATTVDSELLREAAPADVRRIALWAVTTQDPAGLPFVVVDPGEARIYAFDPQGLPTGNAPVRVTRADDAFANAGRLVADLIASARSGAIVWTNADTQLAVSTGDEDAHEPLAAALRVAPAFWRACLATLRTQPSIAYVLPHPPAAIASETPRKPS